MNPRKWVSCLAVLASSIAVTACGSDESASSGESVAKSSTKLSGPPIKTLTFTTIDAPTNNYKNLAETARIYEEWVNANGGIKGRPLEVIICDDHGQPADAAACARQAVSEGVTAVVASFSFFGTSIVPILTQNKIAYFGQCCGLTEAEYTAPNSFQLGSQPIYAAGEVQRAVKDGCKNINGVVQAGTEAVLPVLKNALKSYGREFGKVVILPATSSDLSPQVSQATSGGADCLVMFVAETVQTLWNKNFVQSGSKARLYGLQGNLDDVSIKGLGKSLDGSVVAGQLPDLSEPVWADYRKAIKTYKADPALDYNSLGGLGAWAGYTAFVEVASAIPGAPATINAKTFLAQAAKTTKVDTGGMYPVLDLTKEWSENPPFKRVFNRSVIFQTIKDGKVVPLTRGFNDVGNLSLGLPPTASQR